MKTLLAAALIGLSTLGAGGVLAHGGAVPKHGGVVQTASDLSFELVGTADGAVIYVEDHGKPMAPTGFTGKLTVLNGSEKSEAPIAVAADKLEAKGVKLGKGAKVVASLTTPKQKAITVRFTVK
ncbi:hypothetical protein [Aquabacterium sp.]|uniref:hypothetical protein n=1 Tax=Aquabacterium sp. TaxID=1872578 RepID=UPI002D0756C1|nr:hypothetical protein [Aquabacterium sp.]HSW08030.1 hypothetical protein [Aquabacterium sp.]